MATHNRPESVEQNDPTNEVPDGDSSASPSSSQSRRLDGVYRSQRCLFSSTDKQEVSSIPEICVGSSRISVPGLMFWPLHGPPGVHQNNVQRRYTLPQTRYQVTQVPRRLADSGRIPPGSRICQGQNTPTIRTPGTPYQLGEIRPESHTETDLPGNRHRHHPGKSLPLRTEGPETSTADPIIQRVRQPPSLGVVKTDRTLSFLREIGTLGSISSKIDTIPATTELVPSNRRETQVNPNISGCTPRPDLVGGSSASVGRNTSSTASSGPTAVHRCLHPGMGSSPLTPRSLRPVVSRASDFTYQYARAPGGQIGIRILPRLLPGQDHSGDVGQFHGCIQHQETRGNQIMGSMLPDARTSPVGQRTEDNPSVKVHSGKEQCSGRSTQSKETDPPCRVVSAQRHMQSPVEVVGIPPHRSVRHKQKSSASSILFPSSGSSSLVNRRSSDTLEQPVGVRLSTPSSANSSVIKAKSDIPVRNDPDCTKMAPTTVVCRPSPSASRPPKRAASLEDSAKTTSSRQVSQKSRNVQLTRMEAIQSALRKKGFSREAAKRISQPNRKSTTDLYQAKWAQFCSWARTQSLNPLKASVPVIVDFLIFLREQKNLSSTAIKGYRSALAPVFLHRGLDISSSPEISALLKNFDQEIIKTPAPTPKWDLNIVLQSLTRHPYEPLKSCSLKALTHKTVFLLALASAKRVSELHGLSYIVSWALDKSSATLRLCPEFIAKTQIPGDPSTRYDPITIPALTNLIDKSDEEYLLCPLRALQRYLSRTSAARPRCTRLFMSTTSTVNHRSISKNTVSFWIRSVIKSAYQEAPQSDLKLWKVSAHEVRAIATSLLFKQNASVKEVMNAASWRSRSTFVAFYLRDLGHQYLDVSSLGPFVAAQAVIQPTRPDENTRTTDPSSKKRRGGAPPAPSAK